jgi:hypothetical protein
MPNSKNYTLEYCVSKRKFPQKRDLENYVKQTLGKFIENLSFEVNDNEGAYLILSITSTSKIIDACHDKLSIERSWAFRSKDELGDFLRKSSYPVLSNIEITIRNFINQTMSEIFGFNWWDLFTPENIRKKVETIEAKTGKSNIELQHQIEFTLFDDLIEIVTEEYQAWSDNHIVTASELVELLSNSTSIEDIHKKLTDKRKVMSFWNDVFSNYFDDKEAWVELKEKIKKYVIPTRNKVMHHRLIRKYELQKLNECYREINHVINLAKTELSSPELEKSKEITITILRNAASIDTSAIAKAMQIAINNMQPPDTSAMMKALQIAANNMQSPDTSAVMKALQIAANNMQSPDTSAVMRALQIAANNMQSPDTSAVMKALQIAANNIQSPDTSAVMKALHNIPPSLDND